jgi:hypothetical protein
MTDNKNKPVQVVLTYNANNSVRNTLQTKIMTGQDKKESQYLKLDDNHKLVRRYSFDDNGGGYRGL